VKIALELANGISAINAIWIPNICNPMDNCPEVAHQITNGLGALRRKNVAGCMESCIPNVFRPEDYSEKPNSSRAETSHDTNSNRRRPPHHETRGAFCSGSRRDVGVCGTENGLEAVQKTKEMKPDLVILDISMPLLDGFGAARQIKEMSPLTPILICSLHRTAALLEVAQKIGVSGYISKSEDIPSLLKGIEVALHNQTYFPS
jgi:CheY-like chemotaxis protein